MVAIVSRLFSCFFFSSLESDMMSSVSAAALHSQQHPHYNSVATHKEAPLKSDPSHTSSQMSDSVKIKVTNPQVRVQQQIPFSELQVNDGDQNEVNKARGPETETGGEGTEGTASGKEAKEEFASKSYQSTTVSSALSLVSGTDSRPSFTTIPPMITAVTTAVVSKQTHPTMMFSTTLQPHTGSVLQNGDAPPSEATPGSSHTGFLFYPSSLQPGSANNDQPTDTPAHTPSGSASSLSTSSASPASSSPPASTSFPSFSASASLSPGSAQAEMKTQRPGVILPSNTTTEPRSHLTDHTSTSGPPPWSPSLSPPPVCPESTCSVNNGGCSQLCSHTQHYNQSSNQNYTRTQCRCRPGFLLLGDGRTCRGEPLALFCFFFLSPEL